MVRVGIYQARPDSDPQLGWTQIATITADRQQLTTAGDPDKLAEILKLTVPRPGEPGQSLTSHEHPEAWAAGLPTALRGPVIIARVEAPAAA
jgi:hypothetical protein